MAQKKFSELEAGAVDGTSIFAQTKTENGSLVSKGATASALAGYIGTSHQFAGLNTDAKDIIGAVNEAAQSGGGASVIQLTQAEYTALSTAEKMNGSIYKLTDKAVMYCLDEEYHALKELTSAQYEALTTAEQNNGTLYIKTDAEITGEDIPVNSVSPNTSIDSAINACWAKTASDIPMSSSDSTTVAEAIEVKYLNSTITLASGVQILYGSINQVGKQITVCCVLRISENKENEATLISGLPIANYNVRLPKYHGTSEYVPSAISGGIFMPSQKGDIKMFEAITASPSNYHYIFLNYIYFTT